jgi:hypothetical protein
MGDVEIRWSDDSFARGACRDDVHGETRAMKWMRGAEHDAY